MSEALVTLDRVTLRLRDRFLLENTSWRIEKGEQWAVIGPNGAGKSTLVGAIAGEVPVVQGRIRYRWAAEHPSGPRDHLKAVARVSFDREMGFPRASGGGNLAETCGERACSPALDLVLGDLPQGDRHAGRLQRLEGIAEKLDLGHLLRREARALSNGEMRKIAIARALMRSPKLLILDEPYEGLDPASRRGLNQLVDQLISGGVQILLVTHRFEEISGAVSHVLAVRDCTVCLQGERKDVLTPANIARIYKHRPAPGPGAAWSGARGAGGRERGPEVLVSVRNGRVKYGERLILDNVSWTMKRGENWAVLGENGSGKSKLLDLITGDDLQAYANEIFLFGRRRGTGESLWDIRARLGMVSSEFQMNYRRGIVAYDVICSGFFDSIGLYRRCTPEQHRVAKQWIRLFGISDFVQQRFDQLSYGQKRLVLLARAVVKAPPLLILDEPCDGLDMVNRRRILDLIQFIGAETKTNLIYVTYRQEEIPRCITHVMVLRKGRVVSMGERDRGAQCVPDTYEA